MPDKNYTGVKWIKESSKWQATVMQNSVKYNCGLHETKHEAVKSRDKTILQKGLNVRLQLLKPVKK